MHWYLLWYLGGSIIGWICCFIWHRNTKSATGYFTVTPYEDDDLPGYYKVNIHITDGQNLLNKHRLILTRDDSHR